MAGSTYAEPSAPNLMSDPSGVAEAAAAMAAGLRAAQERQALYMAHPEGELREAVSALQPFIGTDPGSGEGGVT